MKNQTPQGHTIKDVFEIIESPNDNVEILRNRIKNIRQYSTLGPPDICYLSKKYQNGSILSMNKEQIKQGSYHYVHGINLSTPASVSAYINELIKNLEEEKQSLFQRGEWKIVKGYFCIFDSFSKIDIHIEITIPGTMKLYGFTIDNELVTITDQLWERAMVSSGLRSMHLQDVPAGKYFPEFQNEDQINEFLKAFSNVVQSADLPYENSEEMEKHFEYRGSKAIYLLIQYLIRKRMYGIAFNFLIENVNENPKMILHLNRLYMIMKQQPEGIKLLANYLIQQPESPQLLYQQARNLYYIGKYEDAYRLTNFLIGILSCSFDVWFLLAEIFYKLENYEFCLVALNQASDYVKVNVQQGQFPDISSTNSMLCENIKGVKQLTQPKEWGSISTFNNIFVVNYYQPQILKSKLNLSPNDKLRIQQTSQEQFDVLSKLHSQNFSEDEYKIYQLIIEMEKRLGWENIIKLRGNIFMLHSENQSQFYDRSTDFPFNVNQQNIQQLNLINNQPGLMTQGSKSHPSQDSQNSFKTSNKGDENSVNNIGQANQPTLQQQKSSQQQETIQIEFPPEYDGNDLSDGEDELPQFLKDDNEDSKQKNYGMANIKDPQIQKNIQRKLHIINIKQSKVQNNPKFEKNNHITELTEDSMESERVPNLNVSNKLFFNNQSTNINIALSKQKKKVSMKENPNINDLLPYPNKRLIHKILNQIFQSLYEDLNYMIRWQNEDKQKEEIASNFERIKFTKQNQAEYVNMEQQLQQMEYTPELWLFRAQLALRLKVHPLAEKALREVLKRNFCFYCFDNLIRIAEERDEPKKVIYVIAELLDEMELYGVKSITSLPSWVEDHLFQLISQKGLRIFKSHLNELKFEDKVITECIKKANQFKIEGTQDQQQQNQKITPHMRAIDAFSNNQYGGLNKIRQQSSYTEKS